jgi:cation:H+ antiporter
MDILLDIGLTLLLLIGIVWACTLFTNAIEWAGHRFQLSEGAVGSVLAAVGTALPETLVPIVALLAGVVSGGKVSHEHGESIGVGAILGAPFLLSTLAMFVSGAAVIWYTKRGVRNIGMNLDIHLFKRDFHYFFVAYVLAIGASFLAEHLVKYGIGFFLWGLYAFYVYKTLQIEHIPDDEFHLDPLTLAPRNEDPSTAMIMAQAGLGLLLILLFAHLFVEDISQMSHKLGIAPLILSLIIIPIATELPEKFNSVTWIGKGKDNLALGNMTGAMVFQSCIPTSFGLWFTPWHFDFQGLLSVVLCLASSVVIYLYALKNRRMTAYMLLFGGLFYLIFLGYSLSLVFEFGF